MSDWGQTPRSTDEWDRAATASLKRAQRKRVNKPGEPTPLKLYLVVVGVTILAGLVLLALVAGLILVTH